jgi:putative FmdB family regulatory protein
MPTYDYKCGDCDNTATLITSIREEIKIPICAKCKHDMVRDYGSPSISFTGSGFYTTDKGKK